MIRYSRKQLDEMERLERLLLVNAITGIKPANLIGTKDETGTSNLAIFSSVVHMGSNPPLLGMFSRPDEKVRRHTLENITASTFYTINHLSTPNAEQGHYTSAGFEKGVSEFEKCGFTEEYLDGFSAPYVKESPIKIGMKLKSTVPIKENGTILIIGEIIELYIHEKCLSAEGEIDLQRADSLGISGVGHYYSLTKEHSFPYARVSELPSF